MKYLIAVAALISLTACTPLNLVSKISSSSPGNPAGQPYVGTPGSVYDPAANPPATPGAVAYNPDAPVPAMPMP